MRKCENAKMRKFENARSENSKMRKNENANSQKGQNIPSYLRSSRLLIPRTSFGLLAEKVLFLFFVIILFSRGHTWNVNLKEGANMQDEAEVL